MTGGGGVPDFAFPEKNAIFTPDAPIRQKTHAMYRLSQYKETDKMGDLICENYPILLSISQKKEKKRPDEGSLLEMEIGSRRIKTKKLAILCSQFAITLHSGMTVARDAYAGRSE